MRKDRLVGIAADAASEEVELPMLSMTATANPSCHPAARLNEFRRGLAEIAPELYGRALRLTRSRALAEDLVQDTALRAMRFEDHYQPGTNLRAYLHQILFSVFITRCRRSRRERNALDHLANDPCAWPFRDSDGAMSELSPPMARALDALPPTFRDVVRLVDLEDMAYKDAAHRLGVPVGTVMSRLHRGRRLLARSVRADPTPIAEASADACETERARAA